MAYQREDAQDGLSGVEIEFSFPDEDDPEDEAEDTETEQTNPTTHPRSETVRGMISVF